MDYRGIYDRNENNNEQRYYEFGAHFRYNDLVRVLKALKESQNNKKEKTSNLYNNNLNSNNTNYNELYNQINRQLCEKMTDIISPNKLIQSRNIQPLIQSLSQKLTDIVQSQNNKKQMKHNVTKKKYINSNCSIKQKEKKSNVDMKNINMENNNKFNNMIIGLGKQLKGKYPSSAKPQNISQSRNYLNNKNKKILSKNNIKNIQKSINKKINLTSQEIKQNKFAEKKMQKPLKNLNSNNNNNCFKNNDNIIYGEILENNNSNNKQNTQTVQNIIVKPNINISFINNYNTTFLPKNKMKKRSPKKVRSRNNQEFAKLNMIGNQFFNVDNNNLKIHGDFDNINKICQNNNNNDNNNNCIKNNKFEIIFSKNNNENIKEKHKKSPFVSPKLKNKDNINDNKKNIIEFNSKNIIMNGNNNVNKELNPNNNKAIQEKMIRNINKKLINNLNEKAKINKTSNEINQVNNLKNEVLANNYIQNNYTKLYGNFNKNNNIQRNKLNYINSIIEIKKKNLVIGNNIILANNITDKKVQNNNILNKNPMSY